MITGAFPLGDLIARLKAKVVMLRDVGNSADLDSVMASQPNAVPAAYALSQERGEKNKGASGGMFIQRCSVAVQVVLFVRNFSRVEQGGGARSEMDALAKQVDDALINWTPISGIYLPLWFTAGADTSFKAGTLAHQRIYSSEYSNRTGTNP